MARKLRLEFPGACYHVINRGNYRADVFKADRTKAAFEACLFETCAKSGWLLHAFVIMRNHYHLAVETPEGNLVAGMQWLQATFANRFNRIRNERGHLFQGRYKALLVEEGDPLARVCHYIHLNPVRAAIKSVDRLGEYRYSSYWYLQNPDRRPKFFRTETALAMAGNMEDTPAGRRRYAQYLSRLAQEGPKGQSRSSASLSRGWALGSPQFKSTLVQDHAVAALTRAWESAGAKEIRERQWAAALAAVLKHANLSLSQCAARRKSDPGKLAIAAWMKLRTQASAPWLCQQLNLGSPDAFRRNVSHYCRHSQATDPFWTKISEYST
jgi:putative transposase